MNEAMVWFALGAAMANKQCLKLILDGDPAGLPNPSQTKMLDALGHGHDAVGKVIEHLFRLTPGVNGQMATSLVEHVAKESHLTACRALCHKMSSELESVSQTLSVVEVRAWLLKQVARVDRLTKKEGA